MNIPAPYLLMLGDSSDPLSIKTARGIHYWRPEKCLAQLRLNENTASLSLPEMDVKTASENGAKTLVLGTANAGGVLAEHWIPLIVEAISLGMNIASGLHQKLTDVPAIAEAADKYGVTLFDIRHNNDKLDVGSGEKRAGKRLLTVGTDCSVGKMFTTLALEKVMLERGMDATFCATGQTGILIQGSGIAIDAVVADFISGATEALSPACNPERWQLVEGQGSLLNPAFSGVTMGLLHGAQPDALVLCHEVGRDHMRHLPHVEMPSLDDIMSLSLTMATLTNPNPRFVGIAVNTSKLDDAEALTYLNRLSEQYKLPATDPVRYGVASIVDHLESVFGG
ncbi:N-acetyltransferase DgcN [Enterovibrio coralii]|uniref:EBNA-1 nuclear protein n=1 Tax=Enterovibrio coralii TaxID=294935 RepID=A0A135ICC8_9GAMM|nr:N-acetyltransferase DgcN [Enterovibrio coralii]KXF83113.1 EBNA-1 nuclear protein [Enterovibrio coralii]